MKIACYTDIHNQQIMLNYPTVLRKSAVIAAENTLKEFGKTDLSIIGGDNVSDYPLGQIRRQGTVLCLFSCLNQN